MRIRLVSKSWMASNDLERPKRTLSQKRCVFLRPMILASENIGPKVYGDVRGGSSWRGRQ